MKGWLVDTGPLVAMLDRDDPDHRRCVEEFRRTPPPLVTTWPVLTEAAYLLGFSRRAQDALLEIVQRGAVAVAPLAPGDVPRLRALMEKYREVPMDLADATIVRVAEREGMADVFSLDSHFKIYRLGRGRPMSIKP